MKRFIAGSATIGLVAFVGLSSVFAASIPRTPAVVSTINDGRIGLYLTDFDGLGLYAFSGDVQGAGASACYDACDAAWPAFLTDGLPWTAEGADGALIGTIIRADGGVQVTYNGWPLYFSRRDTSWSDKRGHGRTEFGGVWTLLDIAGNPVPIP